MSNDDPIYTIAKQTIDQALQAPWSKPPLDGEAVHELRVLSKKLRGLLRLCLPHVKKSLVKHSDQQLQQFADHYAESRDAAVLHDTLTQLISRHEQQAGGATGELCDYFAKRAATEQSLSNTSPDEHLKLIVQDWPILKRKKTGPALTEGINFTYSKAQELARQAEISAADDDYHRCRKWLKYYMYQIELSEIELLNDGKKHYRRVKKLAQRLGLFHDRCVLEAALLAIPETQPKLADSCAEVLVWLIAEKADDKHACHKLFAKIFRRGVCPLVNTNGE